MMKVLFYFLLLLLTTAFAGCPKDRFYAVDMVGKVLDEQGKPIKAAKVIYFNQPGEDYSICCSIASHEQATKDLKQISGKNTCTFTTDENGIWEHSMWACHGDTTCSCKFLVDKIGFSKQEGSVSFPGNRTENAKIRMSAETTVIIKRK